MHLEILDEKRKRLLKTLSESVRLRDYYMAGGTTLSLQMGLRKSADFDFFVPHTFNTDELLAQLSAIYPERMVLQQQCGTLDLKIHEIQVSYFYYPYRMLESYTSDSDLPSLRMATVSADCLWRAMLT